jgi:ATP-binding protein involved in chromosome partitioning
MHQGVERLRVPNARKVVAVSSGKGGVGKSTIAVNLAVGLAQQGYRVGLLDADVHGPNVPLMLGVRRKQAARGWQAMLPIAADPERSATPTLPALERYGVQMMSIGLLIGEEQTAMVANVSTVGWLVRNLLTMVEWGDLDLLLIDFPPGTSEPQATLLATVELDGVIIVVTPQDLALLDSTRTLRAFQETGVPVTGVVENMSYLICPHCGEPIQVFHRSKVSRPVSDGEAPLLGKIPLDPAISEAGDTGRPLLISSPESPQARVLIEVSEVVAKRLSLRHLPS